MTKYIKGKDGKFKGSISDGKHSTPTSAPPAPGITYVGPEDTSAGDPFESVRSNTRPVISRINDVNDYPITRTMVQQIGSPTLLSVSGGRVAAIDDNTIVMPVDKEVTVEAQYEPGSDTYTVRRLQPIMTGRVVMNNPDDDVPPGFVILGEQTDVYADELSERVYWAGMYHNGHFPSEV